MSEEILHLLASLPAACAVYSREGKLVFETDKMRTDYVKICDYSLQL